MSKDVAIAQIVTAITTVFYAAVFAIGYYLMIKGNREVLREMREERLSGGRPQVIVETSLLSLPIVEFVVRNVSGGAAKDITLEFSGPIEDSSGFVISELRYIREGIPFLGPGERIRCIWDHIDRLVPYLREKRLYEGIAVKVSYKDLPGEAYTTEWRINPLLYEGLRYDASQLAQLAPGLLPEKIPADAKSDKASDSQRGVRNEDGGHND
ncbi:MAG: hypothetical protein M3358_10980 [Actinomycetota bacterium]|nr:hypothetical protein [Actinomycetota bacterium]